MSAKRPWYACYAGWRNRAAARSASTGSPLRDGCGAARARGERLLADFDLANLGDRHPLSLSGGQKQRLVIAAARATGRPIVILDEPTSGVDARHLYSIVDTLRRIAREGAAVIVVTHDGEFASACADRLITLTPTGAGRAREGGSQ